MEVKVPPTCRGGINGAANRCVLGEATQNDALRVVSELLYSADCTIVRRASASQ